MSGGRARAAVTKSLAALVVGATLVALTPAVAQAGGPVTFLDVGSKVFPSGAALPLALAGHVPVSLGSLAALTAPEYIYEPPSGSATTGSLYEFMFWDVDHSFVPTERARFIVPGSLLVPRATAWYLPICLPGTSCGSGGATAVTTWAFSLTDYKVLAGTPISSVTPSSAWTSPSTSVSTASSVTINAASYFGTTTPPPPLTGGTVFSKWFPFPRTKAITVSGLALSVPAGASSYAIAFYYYYPPHTKPICIGYPYCI